jgi:hypothetical protein
VNTWDIIPVLLIVLFSAAISIGTTIIVLVSRRQGEKTEMRAQSGPELAAACPFERTCSLRRPGCWLAVKSRNLAAVQSALGLHHPKPCTWQEGFSGEEKLFIAPPFKGWILVSGSGLPEPSEDVDLCYRFVMMLSRRLGQVQLFSANPIVYHHAWVQANAGKVVRAYAWAGRTLWQQGRKTAAEAELALRCFEYTEPSEPSLFGHAEAIAANVEKVPLLAARWSLDPARIDEAFLEKMHGIAGEPSRRF